ncbi:MAG: membrane integrity-associated transporter subunit PqiC [Dokdonella sp.]|uniref:ABC-type transport auxiliary lipoprotein family protein n=1 Tax=Dokdonella sp. TaxID=2291710 RepID=UPI0025BD6F47|nr:ABC-type transport auxiliary lipoprotein family protein [Dokdonella sp.]MBZ0222393.1 ABC-type transport auxiliary lipoprotein family protein [Dokdonella sp.]MCC7256307.1 membrane integrity-associated transporter subunit PqiC [Dokdonella sp.]
MKIVRLPLLLAALTLAGCASLLGKPQPFTIYAPGYSPPTAPAGGEKVNWQLLVETPQSSETLNTPRIVVMPSPGVIEVYPGARWSDPAPALLRRLIVQGFEQSGRILGVGSPTTGLNADYALAIDLHAFQGEVRADGSHAVVAFQARLLDYRSSRVLASRAFNADEPIASKDSAAAFNAFQSAVSESVASLVEWTLQEGSAAQKSR